MARPIPSAAFPRPEGAADAFRFEGEASLERSRRREALRARAEGRAAAPAGSGGTAAGPAGPGAAADWPRPPSCIRAGDLLRPPEGARVAVCGLVIVRQRPGSAKGVIFLTLEDETGVANIVVWTRVYEACRRAVIAGRLLRVTGRIQRDGQVTHVVAERVEDVSALLDTLAAGGPALSPALAHADEVRRPQDEGSRRPKRSAETRAQGLIRSAPRAMHPREQAKRLINRPEGPCV